MLNFFNVVDFQFLGDLEQSNTNGEWNNLLKAVGMHLEDSSSIYRYCMKFRGAYPTLIELDGERGFELQIMFLTEQSFIDLCNDNFTEPEDKWFRGCLAGTITNYKMIRTEEGYRLIDNDCWPKYFTTLDFFSDEGCALDEVVGDEQKFRQELNVQGIKVVRYSILEEELPNWERQVSFAIEFTRYDAVQFFFEKLGYEVSPEDLERIQSFKHLAIHSQHPIGCFLSDEDDSEAIEYAERHIK